MIAYSTLGNVISDQAEKHFGMVANDDDKERLRKAIPKITTIDRRQE